MICCPLAGRLLVSCNKECLMNLKNTLYDVLLNRVPYIFEYIEKDIEFVKEKGLLPPFGSTDTFSKYYSEYLEVIIQELIKSTQNNLRLVGKTHISDNEIESLVRKEIPNTIGYINHAEYLSLFNFMFFGKKTLYFDNQLVEHLAYTKLDAPSELIIPPFESCLFVYSSPLAIKALFNLGKNRPDIDLETPISVFIANRPCDEGLRKLIFTCWQANTKSTNIFVKRELLVRKDWTIDTMLKTDWRDIYKDFSENEILYDESIFYEAGLLFFHILINSILYLGSNDPDIISVLSNRPKFIQELETLKSPGKIKDLNRKIKATSALDFNLVGKSTGAITVRKPSGYENNELSLKIKLKGKRFIVRGHWRRQHYGEGSITTRLTWIRPYFKGPELAQLINKPYNVK